MVEILNLEAVLMPRIALLLVFPQTVEITEILLFRFALACLSVHDVPCGHGSALGVHFNYHSCTGQQRATL